jgi:hypothetical protein
LAPYHAGQHVALAVPQYRLGHPGPPCLRLGDARAHQLQPGEERRDVGERVVVPGRAVYSAASCLPRPSSSTLAAEMTRQLPGAISRAYPAVTARAASASMKCRTAPRMTHTGRADDGPQLRVRQHGPGVAQVRGDGGHPVAGGQQRPGMGQHDGINVDVGDPGGGNDLPSGLVDRGRGGEPGAQVDELADTLPGGPADRLGHERPVLPDQIPQRRVDSQQPLSFGPVGGK